MTDSEPAPAACNTCERAAQRDAGTAPRWDAIVRTPHWDLVHAYDTAVEGWLVLVARRHLVRVADLTDAEAAALGPLVRDTSRALHAVVGCPKTYIVQFAEHHLHPHVHVHVIPRAAGLPAERRGPQIFSLVGVPPALHVPEARRDEIAAAVRQHLGPHR